MKARKILGNLLTGLGCVALLIGLAAFILPKINNAQLRLVLSSFQTPSDNGLIQLMNNGMNFAMEHCYPLLLIGSAVMLCGILMILSTRTDEEAQALRQSRRAASAATATAANPYARPTDQPNPFQPPVAEAPQPEEHNPFARYIAAEVMPKSTVSRTMASKPETVQPAPEAKLDKPEAASPADQPPLLEQGPVQPTVHIPVYDDDEPFRRPVAQESADDKTIPDSSSKEALPSTAAAAYTPDDPVSTAQAAVSEVFSALIQQTDHSVEVPPQGRSAISPQPTASPAAARPIIRSTFRKSTQDQPVDEAADEAAIPAFSTGTTPSLQPASRIKSTMGRKH